VFRKTIRDYAKEVDRKDIAVEDYTVLVRNIPTKLPFSNYKMGILQFFEDLELVKKDNIKRKYK